MSSERSLLGELMYRRVPQFLGPYVAGVWLSIEFGNWLSEQFALPSSLTWLGFLFLAAMIPSVALLAWRYGAPGKDEPLPTDRYVYGVNAVLAAALVGYFSLNPVVRPAATQETLATAAPAAAPENTAPAFQGKRVMLYFWRNETAAAPDWIGYGVPFLIGEDMDRASQAFVVRTPFASESYIEELRRVGFERAIGEPQALQMEAAQRRNYQYFVRGSFKDAPDGLYSLHYALFDAANGRAVLEGEELTNEAEIFTAIDAISTELQAFVAGTLDSQPEIVDLPMTETVSNSVAALEHYINGRIAYDIDTDAGKFQRATALFSQAIDVDPQFAEAYGMKGVGLYLSGQLDQALPLMNQALDYKYRLSREMQFRLRYMRAAMQNNMDEAIGIVRVWTEVEPDNQAAFSELAKLNFFASADLDEALVALKRVREINPLAIESLRRSAAIETQRDNLDAAMGYLREFIDARPDDSAVVVQLAEIQTKAGDFDGAMESYRRAALLDGQALGPQLGAISVLMRRGDFSLARDQLEQLRGGDLTDQEQMELLNIDNQLSGLMGQYEAIIERTESYEELAQRLMPPLLYGIQYRAPAALNQAYLGRDPAATIAELEAVRADMQPPWTDFLHLYDLTVHAIAEDAAAYAASFEKFNGYIATQPNNNNLSLILATANAQGAYLDGEFEAVRQHTSEALTLASGSVLNVVGGPQIYTMRADMYDLRRRIGDADIAIEGLLQVVEAFPGLALGHLRLAQAYSDLGRKEAAREALSVALEIWRNADPAYIYIAEADELAKSLGPGA